MRRCLGIRGTEDADDCFYDDAQHEYFRLGERQPSVTQALTLTGRIDSKWFTPESAERGRQVHAVTVALDELGTLSEQNVDSAIGGYVDAYRMFKRDIRPIYDGIEQAYWHRILRYGGRPDRSCQVICGTRGTLELKTSGEYAWHGVQLAGYERLRPRGARWVCYLQKNGRYRLRQCRRADDHTEFLRALRDVWAEWDRLTAVALLTRMA